MQSWAEAELHYEAGLAANTGMGARPLARPHPSTTTPRCCTRVTIEGSASAPRHCSTPPKELPRARHGRLRGIGRREHPGRRHQHVMARVVGQRTRRRPDHDRLAKTAVRAVTSEASALPSRSRLPPQAGTSADVPAALAMDELRARRSTTRRTSASPWRRRRQRRPRGAVGGRPEHARVARPSVRSHPRGVRPPITAITGPLWRWRAATWSPRRRLEAWRLPAFREDHPVACLRCGGCDYPATKSANGQATLMITSPTG
jgi:hypothetical protein